MLFFIALFLSCSKYTISNGEDTADEADAVNVYIKFQENQDGDMLDIEYPVCVFCEDKSSSELKEFSFSQGDDLKFSVSEGEYGIFAFVGLNENNYVLKNSIDGKPMIEMKNNVSDVSLMSAQTSLTVNKNSTLNLIPSYIVSSAEMEFSNIPSEVKSLSVSISPVSGGYMIDGGYVDNNGVAGIDCHLLDNKWVSGQKYLFPVEGKKTTISVTVDYGNSQENYSCILLEGMEPGRPYKFTGGYGEDLSLDGDFHISGWKMEEEIVMDFENEKPADDESDEGEQSGGDEGSGEDSSGGDIDVFYVETMPSANKIWGPFYIWKLEETGVGEAQATIIAPDQWYQIYKEGEAMEILNGYEIDEISEWRTFTKEEAQEFFKEFSTELDELNPYLEENGHHIFYTEDRYLCENGGYAFNMFGATNIRPAGRTVKYYLRPIKKIGLKVN